MTRVLAITGACCAGKTTVANALNEHLGWDRLSIDQEREQGGDWPSLTHKVRHLTKPTIVESIAMPSSYRSALNRHDTTTALVTCDELERQRRLQARQETRPTGRQYSLRFVNTKINATHALTDEHLQQLAAMAQTPGARQPAGES
jgi:gluconate kinase